MTSCTAALYCSPPQSKKSPTEMMDVLFKKLAFPDDCVVLITDNSEALCRQMKDRTAEFNTRLDSLRAEGVIQQQIGRDVRQCLRTNPVSSQSLPPLRSISQHHLNFASYHWDERNSRQGHRQITRDNVAQLNRDGFVFLLMANKEQLFRFFVEHCELAGLGRFHIVLDESDQFFSRPVEHRTSFCGRERILYDLLTGDARVASFMMYTATVSNNVVSTDRADISVQRMEVPHNYKSLDEATEWKTVAAVWDEPTIAETVAYLREWRYTRDDVPYLLVNITHLTGTDDDDSASNTHRSIAQSILDYWSAEYVNEALVAFTFNGAGVVAQYYPEDTTATFNDLSSFYWDQKRRNARERIARTMVMVAGRMADRGVTIPYWEDHLEFPISVYKFHTEASDPVVIQAMRHLGCYDGKRKTLLLVTEACRTRIIAAFATNEEMIERTSAKADNQTLRKSIEGMTMLESRRLTRTGLANCIRARKEKITTRMAAKKGNIRTLPPSFGSERLMIATLMAMAAEMGYSGHKVQMLTVCYEITVECINISRLDGESDRHFAPRAKAALVTYLKDVRGLQLSQVDIRVKHRHSATCNLDCNLLIKRTWKEKKSMTARFFVNLDPIFVPAPTKLRLRVVHYFTGKVSAEHLDPDMMYLYHFLDGSIALFGTRTSENDLVPMDRPLTQWRIDSVVPPTRKRTLWTSDDPRPHKRGSTYERVVRKWDLLTIPGQWYNPASFTKLCIDAGAVSSNGAACSDPEPLTLNGKARASTQIGARLVELCKSGYFERHEGRFAKYRRTHAVFVAKE